MNTIYINLIILTCGSSYAITDVGVSSNMNVLHQSGDNAFTGVLASWGNTVLIGSTDNFVQLQFLNSSPNDANVKVKPILHTPDETRMQDCKFYSASGHICVNTIRVIEFVSQDTALICGTNALEPRCEYYQTETETFEVVDLRASKWMSTSKELTILLTGDSIQNSSLYVATSESPGKFYRRSPTALKTSSDWFQEPEFKAIHDDERKGYVYLLFNEKSTYFLGPNFDQSGAGIDYYTMIARVCKNDQGGSWDDDTWMTFNKIRLLCPWPGHDMTSGANLYYDELVSTHQNGVHIFGLFRPSRNWKLRTYAIAKYDTDEIDKYFDGDAFNDSSAHYFDKSDIEKEVVYDGKPSPFFPGQCPLSVPYRVEGGLEAFARKHVLLKASVPPVNNAPIYVGYDDIDYKFLFTQTFSWTTAIFLFSGDGYLKKLVTNGRSANVLFEKRVLMEEEPILAAKLIELKSFIIVSTAKKVISIPLGVCDEYTTCESCSMDPHCMWNVNSSNADYSCRAGITSEKTTCSSTPNPPVNLQATSKEQTYLISWETDSTTPDVRNIVTIAKRSTKEIVKRDTTANQQYNVRKSDLMDGHVYEASVVAVNGNSVSQTAVESFSLDLQQPNPNLICGENVCTIKWSPVTGASKYKVKILNDESDVMQELSMTASSVEQTAYFSNLRDGRSFVILTAASADDVESSKSVDIVTSAATTGITSTTVQLTTNATMTSPTVDNETTPKPTTVAVDIETTISPTLSTTTRQKEDTPKKSAIKLIKAESIPKDCFAVTTALAVFVALFLISLCHIIYNNMCVIRLSTDKLRGNENIEYRRCHFLLWRKKSLSEKEEHLKCDDAVVTSSSA